MSLIKKNNVLIGLAFLIIFFQSYKIMSMSGSALVSSEKKGKQKKQEEIGRQITQAILEFHGAPFIPQNRAAAVAKLSELTGQCDSEYSSCIHLTLGKAFLMGDGVALDRKRALEHLTKSSELGDVRSDLLLAQMHANKDLRDDICDFDRAVFYAKKIIEYKKKPKFISENEWQKIFSGAYYFLGELYVHRKGEPEHGINYFFKAAELGDENAKQWLAHVQPFLHQADVRVGYAQPNHIGQLWYYFDDLFQICIRDFFSLSSGDYDGEKQSQKAKQKSIILEKLSILAQNGSPRALCALSILYGTGFFGIEKSDVLACYNIKRLLEHAEIGQENWELYLNAADQFFLTEDKLTVRGVVENMLAAGSCLDIVPQLHKKLIEALQVQNSLKLTSIKVGQAMIASSAISDASAVSLPVSDDPVALKSQSALSASDSLEGEEKLNDQEICEKVRLVLCSKKVQHDILISFLDSQEFKRCLAIAQDEKNSNYPLAVYLIGHYFFLRCLELKKNEGGKSRDFLTKAVSSYNQELIIKAGIDLVALDFGLCGQFEIEKKDLKNAILVLNKYMKLYYSINSPDYIHEVIMLLSRIDREFLKNALLFYEKEKLIEKGIALWFNYFEFIQSNVHEFMLFCESVDLLPVYIEKFSQNNAQFSYAFGIYLSYSFVNSSASKRVIKEVNQVRLEKAFEYLHYAKEQQYKPKVDLINYVQFTNFLGDMCLEKKDFSKAAFYYRISYESGNEKILLPYLKALWALGSYKEVLDILTLKPAFLKSLSDSAFVKLITQYVRDSVEFEKAQKYRGLIIMCDEFLWEHEKYFGSGVQLLLSAYRESNTKKMIELEIQLRRNLISLCECFSETMTKQEIELLLYCGFLLLSYADDAVSQDVGLRYLSCVSNYLLLGDGLIISEITLDEKKTELIWGLSKLAKLAREKNIKACGSFSVLSFLFPDLCNDTQLSQEDSMIIMENAINLKDMRAAILKGMVLLKQEKIQDGIEYLRTVLCDTWNQSCDKKLHKNICDFIIKKIDEISKKNNFKADLFLAQYYLNLSINDRNEDAYQLGARYFQKVHEYAISTSKTPQELTILTTDIDYMWCIKYLKRLAQEGKMYGEIFYGISVLDLFNGSMDDECRENIQEAEKYLFKSLKQLSKDDQMVSEQLVIKYYALSRLILGDAEENNFKRVEHYRVATQYGNLSAARKFVTSLFVIMEQNILLKEEIKGERIISKKIDKIEVILEKLVRQNITGAGTLLGLLHLHGGFGIAKNYKKAFEFFGTEPENPIAIYQIACMLWNGYGSVKQNKIEAVKLLERTFQLLEQLIDLEEHKNDLDLRNRFVQVSINLAEVNLSQDRDRALGYLKIAQKYVHSNAYHVLIVRNYLKLGLALDAIEHTYQLVKNYSIMMRDLMKEDLLKKLSPEFHLLTQENHSNVGFVFGVLNLSRGDIINATACLEKAVIGNHGEALRVLSEVYITFVYQQFIQMSDQKISHEWFEKQLKLTQKAVSYLVKAVRLLPDGEVPMYFKVTLINFFQRLEFITQKSGGAAGDQESHINFKKLLDILTRQAQLKNVLLMVKEGDDTNELNFDIKALSLISMIRDSDGADRA